MNRNETGEFIGHSEFGIEEAVKDALTKAGKHTRFEIIDTVSSSNGFHHKQYQVKVITYQE